MTPFELSGKPRLYGNRWLNKANLSILMYALLAAYWMFVYPIIRSGMYVPPGYELRVAQDNARFFLMTRIVSALVFAFQLYRQTGRANYFVLAANTFTIKNYLRFTHITYALTDIESIDIKPANFSYNPSLNLSLKNGKTIKYSSAVLPQKEWQRFVAEFNTHGFLLDYGTVI